MTSTRSALILTFFGVLMGAFFWLTDPTLGIAHTLMNSSLNRIDAANQAWPGTIAGLVVSGVMVLTGLWLVVKQPS